jgi:hypothetical protein
MCAVGCCVLFTIGRGWATLDEGQHPPPDRVAQHFIIIHNLGTSSMPASRGRLPGTRVHTSVALTCPARVHECHHTG